MELKYKNKVYSSEQLPIFLFFKTKKKKRDFINDLANYVTPGQFAKIQSVDVALAGSTVIKDKRSTLQFSLESLEEKRSLQVQIFNTDEDSNAIISTPPDIKLPIIQKWIESNVHHLL